MNSQILAGIRMSINIYTILVRFLRNIFQDKLTSKPTLTIILSISAIAYLIMFFVLIKSKNEINITSQLLEKTHIKYIFDNELRDLKNNIANTAVSDDIWLLRRIEPKFSKIPPSILFNRFSDIIIESIILCYCVFEYSLLYHIILQ